MYILAFRQDRDEYIVRLIDTASLSYALQLLIPNSIPMYSSV